MKTYQERVYELEELGITTSDAQGIVDAEEQTKLLNKIRKSNQKIKSGE